jgi:hypothetical protein
MTLAFALYKIFYPFSSFTFLIMQITTDISILNSKLILAFSYQNFNVFLLMMHADDNGDIYEKVQGRYLLTY